MCPWRTTSGLQGRSSLRHVYYLEALYPLPTVSQIFCVRCRATFMQANAWQINFMASPAALDEVKHQLRVDERVLRFILQRKNALPRLPNTFAIRKLVAEKLAGQQGPVA
jgi:Ribosomal protein S6